MGKFRPCPALLCALAAICFTSAPALGVDHLVGVPPGASIPTADIPRLATDSMAQASTVHPYVERVDVDDPVVVVAGDSLRIAVHVVNPSAAPVTGAEVVVEIREPASGYVSAPPTTVVDLPASGTIVVDVAWVPEISLDGLQVDVWADVRVPFARSQDPCGNLIVNGTFDSSCGGWMLEGDNPPAYGVKCNFGYMDVYSTIYNTVPYRYARAYQALLFSPGTDLSDWTVRFRARYATDTGFYGVGVAQTFVQFLHDNGDGTASIIGGYVQFASTAAAPPDEPAWTYDRVQEDVWMTYQLDVGSLVSGLTLPASVDGIMVGAMAYPACSLSNCNPSANAWIDDVGLFACEAAAAAFEGTALVTSLGSGIIGDREAIIRDCFGGDPEPESQWVDLIPLSSAFTMWEEMNGNLCAAGVYQDDGDEVAKNFSLFFAAKAYFDPFFELTSQLRAQTGGQLLTQYSRGLVERGVIGPVQDQVREAMTGAIDSTEKAIGLDERATALARALEDRPSPWAAVALVDGPAEISLTALGRTSTVDVYRHAGMGVHELPDSLRQIVDVTDSIRAVSDSTWYAASEPIRTELLATESGVIDVAMVTQAAQLATAWQYPSVDVGAGDLVWWENPDASGVVMVYLDRGNDGTVDLTLDGTVIGLTSTGDTPMAERPAVASVYARPNPFNPRTTIELSLNRDVHVQVDLLDARGRLVRRLHDDFLRAPVVRLTWDGTDEHGEPVASGVYLVRARSSESVQRTKVTLVR